MKRKLTPAQLESLRKNAAKGRKKLAQMRKQGVHIRTAKEKREQEGGVEIPLAMVPLKPLPPAAPAKRKYVKKEGVVRESVDALAQLIVATWAEVERRKGTL